MAVIFRKPAFPRAMLVMVGVLALFPFVDRCIAAEPSPEITEVIEKTSPPSHYAFVSAQTTGKDLAVTAGTLGKKITDAVQNNSLRPTGPMILTFHGATADPDKPFTLDVGIVVGHRQTAPEGITVMAVVPYRYASVTVTGGTEDVLKGYAKIAAAIAERHLTPSGDSRQILQHWESPDSPNNVTVLRVSIDDPTAIASGSGVAAAKSPPVSSPTPSPVRARTQAGVPQPGNSETPSSLVSPLSQQGTGATPESARVPMTLPKDPYDLYMPGYVRRSPTFGDQVSAGIRGMGAIAVAKEELSDRIAQARHDYWAAYPSGPNLAALGQTYAELMGEKARVIRGTDQLDEMGDQAAAGGNPFGAGVHTGLLLDRMTGKIDGGLDPHTVAAFENWETRSDLGGGGAQKEYQAFALAMATQEFLLYSPTSPSHSTDPAIFFRLIVLRGEVCATFKEADETYAELCKILGKSIVENAVNQVRALPRQADPFLLSGQANGYVNLLDSLRDKLATGARDAADIRTYGLYVLQGDRLPLLMKWQTAQTAMAKLTDTAGEGAVSSALTEIRSHHLDHLPAYRLLRARFPTLPRGDTPAVEPVFHFSNLGGQAWRCLAEGSKGSLIGMRSVSPGGEGLEIVKLNLATGQLTVLAHLTRDSVPGRSGLSTDPAPGSLLARDGWLYGTDSACGLSFKLRDDGRDFSLLKISTDPAPMFTGFDARGSILGVRPHQLFSFSITRGNCTVLATDLKAELGNAETGPDGALYYLSNVASLPVARFDVFVPFRTTVMRVVPGGGAATVYQHIYGPSMISGPLSRTPDGRLFGVMKTVEKYRKSPEEFVVIVGRSTVGISTFGFAHPFHLAAPMQFGLDNRLYGVTISPGNDEAGQVFSVATGDLIHHGMVTNPYDLLADCSLDPLLGAVPATGLILHSDGTLYGVMSQGGEGGQGTLYHVLTPEQVKQMIK